MKVKNLTDLIFNKIENNNTSINTLCQEFEKSLNVSEFDTFKTCKLYLLNISEETYSEWCYLLTFTYSKYNSKTIADNPYLTIYQKCLLKIAELNNSASAYNKGRLLVMMKCLTWALSENLSKYLKLSLAKFKDDLFNLSNITWESIYREFNIDELLKLKHSWQSNIEYGNLKNSIAVPGPSPISLNELNFIDYNLPIYNIRWSKFEIDQDNFYCIPNFAKIKIWKLAFNQKLDQKIINVFLTELYLPPNVNKLLPLIFKEPISGEQILKLAEFNLDLMLVFIDSLDQYPKQFDSHLQLILDLPINVNYLNLISNLFTFEINLTENFYSKLINNLINYCQPKNTIDSETNSNDQIRKLLLTSEFLLSWAKLPISIYLKPNLLELKNTFLSYMAWGNIKLLINWIDEQFNE